MQISAKDIASLLRTLSKTANKPHFTSAIIAAAGCSSRMGDICGGKTKQMMLLGETPIIVRTLQAFEECELINEIIVVAKKDEISEYGRFIRDFGLTKIAKVVEGGETRQESVLVGFEAIDDRSQCTDHKYLHHPHLETRHLHHHAGFHKTSNGRYRHVHIFYFEP